MKVNRRSGLYRQWVLYGAAMFLLAGGISHNLYRSHGDILSGERQRLMTQARVISINFAGQLRGTDDVLKSFQTFFGVRPKSTWSGMIRTGQLRLLSSALAGIRTINVIDEEGIIHVSNRDNLVGMSMASRDYFLKARANPDINRLFVSPPFKTYLNAWGLNLVRVILKPDGTFGGIIAATLDSDYFSTLINSVNYSPDMRSSIAHQDGWIFLIMPESPEFRGRSLDVPGSFFTQHQTSGRTENIFCGKTLTGTETRIMAMITIRPDDLPMDKTLQVAVGRSREEVFRDWSEHAFIQLIIYLLILLFGALALARYQSVQVKYLREAEKAEENLRKLTHGVENSASAVMITDINGSIEYVNRKFLQLSGYTHAEVIGKNPRILKSDTTPLDVYRDLWKTILGGYQWRGELLNRRKDGSVYWSIASISPLKNEEGIITNFIANIEDINERKNAEATIERLAYYDPLTDLPNRRLLSDRIEMAIRRSRRQGTSMALLYLDLDRFKYINDSLGHPAGDELLRQISRRYTAILRDDDLVSRLGGDEFAVVLHDIRHNEDVTVVVNKLLEVTMQPVHLENTEVVVHASIGIALYPDDGDDFQSIGKNADIALYQAKAQGKNTFCFFAHDLNTSSRDRIRIESGLRHALERKELELLFQPKIEISSGRITGVEALIRWNSADMGQIPPVKFIPLAEETRLIIPIGEWVITNSCVQQVAWAREGFNLHMAVNLSSVQFKSPDLIERIRLIIAETGIDPEFLEFELTESALVDNPGNVIATLNGIRELGCGIAIDDFGTGYSSLSYLKSFPVTVLKIDRSFVRDLASSKGDQAIARSVVDLAGNLSMSTVAEGVEHLDQLKILEGIGCHLVQGYLYSKPVTPDEIPLLVDSLGRM